MGQDKKMGEADDIERKKFPAATSGEDQTIAILTFVVLFFLAFCFGPEQLFAYLDGAFRSFQAFVKTIFTFDNCGWAILFLIAANAVLMVWFKRLHPLFGLGICIFAIMNAETYWNGAFPIALLLECFAGTHIGALFAYRSARREKRRNAYRASLNVK